MSDTPRTDANTFEIPTPPTQSDPLGELYTCCHVGFTRTLERELTAAKSRISDFEEHIAGFAQLANESSNESIAMLKAIEGKFIELTASNAALTKERDKANDLCEMINNEKNDVDECRKLLKQWDTSDGFVTVPIQEAVRVSIDSLSTALETIENLKGFARHKPHCSGIDTKSCSCGLIQILLQPDEERIKYEQINM